MFKSPGRTILILLLIGFGLFVLWRLISPRLQGFNTPTSGSVNVDLADALPDSWWVISGNWQDQCDFDRDGENEQLVVYRYDPPATPGPSATAGLIGAVIFDSQVNRVPQEPSVESPYRPALLVPYKLLPDIYTDKGQGYLGEAGIQVTPVPGTAGNASGCLGKEIIITGTNKNNSNAGSPNFLSIFQWGGEKVGYAGVHYTGNAQIQLAQAANGAVIGFTTYDRLDDRSALCEVQPYTRYLPPGMSWETINPEDTSLDFAPRESEYTIAFCSGTPLDPYYPEGVVVALLRGGDPGNTTPTGNSFFTQSGAESLPDLLAVLQNPDRKVVFPILSITNPGTLGAQPEQGYLCPGLTLTDGDPLWWCAREQVNVITDILVNEKPYRVTWRLISLANDKVVGDVHWRIDHVTMQ